MNLLQLFCKFSIIKKLLKKSFQPKSGNSKTLFGLTFTNPVGLAAGFDKNAQYLNELEILGFGFVEIGTVTPLPQLGNAKPRLFRLPKDKALVNRMGFNNEGVKAVAERVKKYKLHAPNSTLLIGGNIGKNKNTPNGDAWKDYEICFNELHDVVDYFVVNVSSPNTPGLRDLQHKDSLRKLLTHLQQINATKRKPKPLLLKIAPDLSEEELDDVISLAIEIKLDGLVAANTTISRQHLATPAQQVGHIGVGGLSGNPLNEKCNRITHHIFSKTKGTIPIISSGGIFTSFDAQEKLNRGASLVQVWTGFIYIGPAIVKNISNGLSKKKAL